MPDASLKLLFQFYQFRLSCKVTKSDRPFPQKSNVLLVTKSTTLRKCPTSRKCVGRRSSSFLISISYMSGPRRWSEFFKKYNFRDPRGPIEIEAPLGAFSLRSQDFSFCLNVARWAQECFLHWVYQTPYTGCPKKRIMRNPVLYLKIQRT